MSLFECCLFVYCSLDSTRKWSHVVFSFSDWFISLSIVPSWSMVTAWFSSLVPDHGLSPFFGRPCLQIMHPHMIVKYGRHSWNRCSQRWHFIWTVIHFLPAYQSGSIPFYTWQVCQLGQPMAHTFVLSVTSISGNIWGFSSSRVFI